MLIRYITHNSEQESLFQQTFFSFPFANQQSKKVQYFFNKLKGQCGMKIAKIPSYFKYYFSLHNAKKPNNN